MALFSRRSVIVGGLAGALAPAWAQERVRVAGIYTVPAEQQWVGRIHTALKTIAARGEIDYVFSENVGGADYERVLRQYAQGGHRLIVGESFSVEALARKVAKQYPKVAFLMGSSGQPQAPNFSVFDNYIHEPAYLSGMVAAGLSKSRKLGLVAGLPIPEVNRLMNAFIAGAKEIDPQAEIMVSFIQSWFDPPKAKQAAFALIDRGADVLYAERFGVSDAARERKVLAIGNVTNTQERYPDTVVVSALWNVEPTIQTALRLLREGRFRGEDYGRYSMMKWKGSELSPLGTFESRVPAELMAQVRAREKSIVEGRFRVRVNDREPRSSREF